MDIIWGAGDYSALAKMEELLYPEAPCCGVTRHQYINHSRKAHFDKQGLPICSFDPEA